jgi:glycosyltransferase involved in cell wall biosynthesis
MDHQKKILEYLADNPVQGLNIHYVDYPLRVSRASSGIRYALWHLRALSVASKLHRAEHFDIAHHVSYSSIHVPTLLWLLNIPVIFGPVGGGQTAPPQMLRYFGSAKRLERLRTLLTRLLRYSLWHRFCLKKMARVLVTNRETLKLCHALGRQDAELLVDTALPGSFHAPSPREFRPLDGPLKLLWVGRLLPRKAIGLTLDIVAAVRHPCELTIIGSGMEEQQLCNMIEQCDLSKSVHWQNKRIPWQEVRAMYQSYDALIFTSLRDSCAAQLLESMAMGLPVITLDLHGASDLVPTGAGYKIPVLNAAQVIADGAAAVERMAQLEPEQRSLMSRTGWEFAQTATFAERAAYAEELYRELLAAST